MKPINHINIPEKKIGILLVNLGTPDGTDYFSMWRYLREFLSDRRIIELPRVLWYPILYLFILVSRPYRSGKLYKKIWNKEKKDSPLRVFSKNIKNKLQKRFNKKRVLVKFAMNYGNPSIDTGLKSLFKSGCVKILVVPLYPQYSATTTASVIDRVFQVLKKMRWQPTIRFCPPYFDDNLYINALALHIRKKLKNLKTKPKKILCSFHGIPRKYFLKGDPYHCHCAKTVRLLNERFRKEKIEFQISFQSRFGPQEWLRPYMAEKFEETINNNEKNMCIIAPGFAVDCLETLEEIKIQGKEDFLEKGGKEFHYIDCLNDSETSINMIERITRREILGWMK